MPVLNRLMVFHIDWYPWTRRFLLYFRSRVWPMCQMRGHLLIWSSLYAVGWRSRR